MQKNKGIKRKKPALTAGRKKEIELAWRAGAIVVVISVVALAFWQIVLRLPHRDKPQILTTQNDLPVMNQVVGIYQNTDGDILNLGADGRSTIKSKSRTQNSTESAALTGVQEIVDHGYWYIDNFGSIMIDTPSSISHKQLKLILNNNNLVASENGASWRLQK